MRFLKSEPARWLLISLAVFLFGLFSILRTPSTDATTVGEVSGIGAQLDGSGCYLTVKYTVDENSFHTQTSQEEKWCDFRSRILFGKTELVIVVHYDSSAPETATLTPRGRLPAAATVLGAAGVLVCGNQLLRRRAKQ